MGPVIKDVGYEVGHCVLNMGFTWTFPWKQNATEKSKIGCHLCQILYGGKTNRNSPFEFWWLIKSLADSN